MLLKNISNSFLLVKLCKSCSSYTSSIRCLFIQTSHLHPRRARGTVVQSQDHASEGTLSHSSTGESGQNECSKEDSSGNSILLKCRELLMSVPDKTIDLENSDVSYYAKFGLVRLDSDNLHHRMDYGEFADELNDVDKQYFGGAQINGSYEGTADQSETVNEKEAEPGEFIDRHYFGASLDKDFKKDTNIANVSLPNSKEDLYKENLNYVDEVFFKDGPPKNGSTDERPLLGADQGKRSIGSFEKSLLDSDDENKDVQSSPSLSPYAKQLQSDLLLDYKSKMKPSVKKEQGLLSQENSSSDSKPPADVGMLEMDESTILIEKNLFDKKKTKKETKETKKESTSSRAYDYAVNLRKQKKEAALQETSEDGSLFVPRYKRIINSVLDLRQLSKYDLRKKLEEWIIYDDHEIVGFYKPYGLRAHGGGERRWNEALTLTDLLPELCNILGADKLHHIHRLDANTTGVLLFARTEDAAQKLRQMFKEHTLIKTYLAIVKNVPSLSHGVIDVPLREGTVDGKTRMVLQPEVEGSARRNRKAFKAVTKFKVVSSHHSAALLSAQPVTGVKHQIRAHFGLVLNCPILADHKYSSSSRMVPQKLPSDMLIPLQMKQSRVRDLPTMLHASSVFLPQFVDGKNLKISCRPPPHFTLALKALKLSSALNATKQTSIDYIDTKNPKL